MYRGMYAGVFKRRYIDGEWTAGDGLIYDMFDPDVNSYDDLIRPKGLPYIATRIIACDYGTANPTVFLDIYDDGGTVWVDRESAGTAVTWTRQACGRRLTWSMPTIWPHLWGRIRSFYAP